MNKPAFPQSVSTAIDTALSSGDFQDSEGMSILEYYAGTADESGLSPYGGGDLVKHGTNVTKELHQDHAKWCFNRAQAMIKEAEKRSMK